MMDLIKIYTETADLAIKDSKKILNGNQNTLE